MPKGQGTYKAQWLRINKGEVEVFNVELVPSGYGLDGRESEEEKVEKAIEILFRGEICYIDPLENLLPRIKNAWSLRNQLNLTQNSPVPSEQEKEFAENRPKAPGVGPETPG